MTQIKDFTDQQLKRIMDRYSPNHKQQVTNMKSKFKNKQYNTAMCVLMAKEIEFLNSKILQQDRLLNLSSGDVIYYKSSG